jgi:hypothetical protein
VATQDADTSSPATARSQGSEDRKFGGSLELVAQYDLRRAFDERTTRSVWAGIADNRTWPGYVLRPVIPENRSRQVAPEVVLAPLDTALPLSKWHDAPFVIIVWADVPEFTPQQIDKLRTYVLQGGTIVSFLEYGGYAPAPQTMVEWDEGMKRRYAKVFPGQGMVPLGVDDDLYTTPNRCTGGRSIRLISNGVRPLLIHCSGGVLPRYWGPSPKPDLDKKSFLANVTYLLTGKVEGLPKGRESWPQATSAPAPVRGIKVARVKYAGNYDPEPLALERFSLLMARDARFKVSLVGATEISKLTGDCQLAAMTGTAAFTLAQADKDALKKYVQGGGTLIIDAAGDSQEFFESAQTLVEEIWGRANLQVLPKDYALYVPTADKELAIEKFAYNFREQGRYGQTLAPHLKAVLIGSRPAVILSKEDMTAGLLGITPQTIDGYMPQTAYQIMRNLAISVCKQ